MAKYKINREFFPFSHFTPPISERFLKIAVPHMKTPRFIYRDKAIRVTSHSIASYDGEVIESLLIEPRELCEKAPCLIYIHGGGFVLAAAGYHYKNAIYYAKELKCKVLFVNYRLAPENPHPVFFEDCYAAACYAYDNAASFGIDEKRIGIGGDSAGAALAVGVCMMARDRGHLMKFVFQMLPYPFLDARCNSESAKRFTDTPMWNSILSERIARMTRADPARPDYVYYSPISAESLLGLPSAYVETAEFDCLHDDGVLYAERLSKEGISVTLNETKGTMHGFDIMQRAKTTRAALSARVEFMRKFF